jgi:hypothetical protein
MDIKQIKAKFLYNENKQTLNAVRIRMALRRLKRAVA